MLRPLVSTTYLFHLPRVNNVVYAGEHARSCLNVALYQPSREMDPIHRDDDHKTSSNQFLAVSSTFIQL